MGFKFNEARWAMFETYVMDALENTATTVAEDSKRTIPLDTGAMRDSTKVEMDKSSHKAVISVGTDYAIYQHENLHFNHLPGRRARWLELTLAEGNERYQSQIAKQIKKHLGS